MALNYKPGDETQSALTTATAGSSIELLGYSKLAIQLKFATCTGTTNTAAGVKVQTSNDGDNWADLKTLATETDAQDLSGDNYFDYLPDNGTADEFGFGKYIRFYCFGSGTFSISYTVTYIAKE